MMFVGSASLYNRASMHSSEAEGQRVLPLIAEAKQRGQRVVFASMGSVIPLTYNFKPGVKAFVDRTLRLLFEEFRRRPTVELMLATTDMEYDAGDPQSPFFGLPPNVHLFSWVPQLRLLPLVDAFISHGGANSLNESLSAGVPMLIIPFGRGDQPTNGAIVHALKAGTHLPFDPDSQLDPEIDPERSSVTEQGIHDALTLVLSLEAAQRAHELSQEYRRYSFKQTIPALIDWIEKHSNK